MSLSTAALLPHSPILIPEIGQANYKFLAKTVAAYDEVKATITSNEVQSLIIISPHSPADPDSFILNIAPEMLINLQDFGFIPAKTAFSGDALLADKISSSLRAEFPLRLTSENILDHGSAIPLYVMKSLQPTIKIVIVSPAETASLEEQFRFGQSLGQVIKENEKNIAVIASGDLSHRLKKTSPDGYSPKGAKFDNKLIEYLSESTRAKDNILKMDANLITGASECALKPITILLGILNDQPWQADILSYQTDFGIGYLSVNFKI